MIGNRLRTTPPMLNALPKDAQIDVTCTGCRRAWSQSVRELVEEQHLGAEFIDLLEMRTRCIDPACGKRVRFACTAMPAAQRTAHQADRQADVPALRALRVPRITIQPDLFVALQTISPNPSPRATVSSPMSR